MKTLSYLEAIASHQSFNGSGHSVVGKDGFSIGGVGGFAQLVGQVQREGLVASQGSPDGSFAHKVGGGVEDVVEVRTDSHSR